MQTILKVELLRNRIVLALLYLRKLPNTGFIIGLPRLVSIPGSEQRLTLYSQLRAMFLVSNSF